MTRKNPVWPWVAAFLVLAMAVTQDGGTNPLSRFAAMRAVTESGTLHINNYVDWTHDWSRSPDGNYYSNKAPGAALLGLPLFAVTEIFASRLDSERRDDRGRRPQPGHLQTLILLLCLQLLPFSFLVLAICRWLAEKDIAPWMIHVFAISALFGNTAAVLMNSHFGHGLAAGMLLAFSWCVLRERWRAAGLFLGLSILTDYGGTLSLPFAFVLVWQTAGNRPKALLSFLSGGLAPAAIWIWYHTAAFGSPFRIAALYINPEQLIEGTPSIFFASEILLELLFGQVRGILVTQPWVLVAGGLFLFSESSLGRRERAHEWFCLATLAALLILNSSTHSWHAGFTPGPRYLSAILPSFALALALRPVPAAWIPAVLLGAGMALVYRGVIYPFSILAPPQELWHTHLSWLLSPKSGTPVLRFAIFVLVMALAARAALKFRSASDCPDPP